MPHLIILEKADCAIAKLETFKSTATNLHEYYHDNPTLDRPTLDAIETALANAETVATNICDGESLASGQSIDGCINEMQNLLP